MKKIKLRDLIFMALCCDLGLVTKKLLGPFFNILTDSLHIPGGIGTSFSLMFLVVAAVLVRQKWCASFMGAVQSLIALSIGMTGSMGALSPIGYIIPGIVMDLILMTMKQTSFSITDQMAAANMSGAIAACLTANAIVFRLRGIVLLLYVCVSALSGSFCGILGGLLAVRLLPIWYKECQDN